MQDMNSGYFGYKMSKRAHDAYDQGEKPYTRWTKKDILEELENNEISEEDLKKLSKYSAETLKAYHPESIWLPRCGEYDRYDHACLLEY